MKANGYDRLTVAVDGVAADAADALFAGPVDGIAQQGLIRMWSSVPGEQEKHVLYTLAQRALIEFEDGDLCILEYREGVGIGAIWGERSFTFRSGAVLALSQDQQTALHIHQGVDTASMLRAFHRYATRMIRLDI